MYIYVYLRVYVCRHTYIYICIYLSTDLSLPEHLLIIEYMEKVYIWVYICIYIVCNIFICTYMFIYVFMYIYIHTYIYIYISTDLSLPEHLLIIEYRGKVYIWMCTCFYCVFMYECVCEYM
jgi:hypothetical protein